MRSKLIVSVVVLLGIGAVWALQELTASPRPGDAFDLASNNRTGLGVGKRHHIGQEVITVFGSLVNESSEPVDITAITFSDEQTHNAKIVDLGLIRSLPDSDGILLGDYQTSPLTEGVGGSCNDLEMHPVTTRVAPDEHFMVAFHIRFRRSGPFLIRDPVIHYRSGSREFFEILRIEVEGDVEDATKPVPVRKDIASCIDDETVLPGNRLKQK